MRDVEGVGDAPEEAAGKTALVLLVKGGGPDDDNQGEARHDAAQLVQGVEPDVGTPDAGHGQQGDEQHAAHEERMGHAEARTPPRQQQTGRKGEQQPRKAHAELVPGQGPAADDVAARRREEVLPRGEGRRQHHHGQQPCRQAAQHEGVEDVGDVLEEERPRRAVERIGLLPATDVVPDAHGEHQAAHHRDDKQVGQRGPLHERADHTGARVEEEGANQRAEHDHRLQAHEAPQGEVAPRHAEPAVVVGIADDEAREDEEEVDGQVTVVDDLVEVARGVRFEQVESHYHDGRYAAQAVEVGKVGFGLEQSGRRG